VWQFTSDTEAVRYDIAKPQSAGDAAIFRRWVGVLVALCFMLPATLVYTEGGLKEMAAKPGSLPGWGVGPMLAKPAQDVLVPWSAGVTLPYALYVYATGWAIYLVSTPGAVLRANGLPPERADSIRAIGRYAAAPLVWLVLATALFLVMYARSRQLQSKFDNSAMFLVLNGLWFLVAVLSLGFTAYRTGQWRARAVHGGNAAGFFGMGELLLRWIVGFAMICFVIPWCIGLVFILIDALFR
jgi:hypothetical protein